MLLIDEAIMGTDNHLNTEFERNDRSTLLIRRMKSHHRETYLHSARVSLYTLLLAGAMGFNQEEQEIIYRSAWLHDIGKLNTPRLMLDHDDSNSDLSKGHCVSGKQIVSLWGDDTWADMDMILYHHENLDGTGYFGRNWKQLSMPTRLLRVTDSYDKMTKHIGKNDNGTVELAFEELFRWSEIIYDASVVEHFYQIMKSSRN